MKHFTQKLLLLLLFVFVASIITLANKSQTPKSHAEFETITWKHFKFSDKDHLLDNSGVFNIYSGISGNRLVMVGWVDSLTSLDSAEKSGSLWLKYAEISDNSTWETIDNIIPFQLTKGISLTTTAGLVCIETENQSGQNRILLIGGHDDKFVCTELASLPANLDKITATAHGSTIYVSGIDKTNQSAPGIYTLDINSGKNWNKLTEYPASAWNYAISAVQSDGFDQCLYLFCDTSDNKTQGYSYNQRLKKWNKIDLPENFTSVEQCHTFIAGVNHIIIAGKKDNDIRLYHTLTNTHSYKQSNSDIIPNIVDIFKKGDQTYILNLDENNKPQLSQINFTKTKSGFAVLDIIVIILYFAALALIGVYFSRRQKNANDYFKGGGRIPWWAAGLSLFGTALSAITFMAIPAKAYATDWSYTLFNTGIILVAPIIMFVFVPFYRKLNITTAYEYLEVRFNSTIRVLCSLAFIIFQVGRMGVVLFLPSIALNVVTGFDIFLCIGLMGVFSIIYTMIGGIEAVVWTDALQVVILIGGALFALVYIISDIPGGFSEVISTAAANNKFSLGDTGFNIKDSSMWTVLIAACFTHLTTYGTDQSMVQRYLTTSSQKEAQKSVLTNAILTIPATIIFFFIGTALFVFYKTYPHELNVSISSGDAIFPWYIFSNLPAGVSGLLISGVFAAAMSTLSGSMNSSATAYVVDIRSKIVRKQSKHSELRIAQMATLVIGVLSLLFAFFMATWNINSLWDEFNKILGLILGSMGGLFLLGMISKRANSQGAMIGLAISIVVQLFVAQFQVLHLLLYTSSGFISCFVGGYIASLFFKNKKQ